jgi:protein-export membrane protein SecD
MLVVSRRKAVGLLLAASAACLGAGAGAVVGETAKIEFRLVDQSMRVEEARQNGPPPQSEVLYGMSDKKPYLVEKLVLLSGADMCDAQSGYDQRTGEATVSFRFGADGKKRFAEVTQANVGRPFAIVLDDAVISAPVIREPILGGSGQISGRFTAEQANVLAKQIRAGAVTKC